MPAAQGWQVLAVAAENLPAAQLSQLIDPVAPWALPALQFRQVVEPGALW